MAASITQTAQLSSTLNIVGSFESCYYSVCQQLQSSVLNVVEMSHQATHDESTVKVLPKGPKIYVHDLTSSTVVSAQKSITIGNLLLSKPIMDSVFHSSLSTLNVTQIKLDHCGLTDASIQPLLGCAWIRQVTKLSLNNNPNISIQTIKLILETQCVMGTPNTLAASTSAVGNANCLTFLSLCQNNLEDEDIGVIASALSRNKSLKRLDLWHNRISDVGLIYLVEALKENAILEALMLSNNRITHAGIQELALLITKPLKPDVPYKESSSDPEEKESVVAPAVLKEEKKEEKGKKGATGKRGSTATLAEPNTTAQKSSPVAAKKGEEQNAKKTTKTNASATPTTAANKKGAKAVVEEVGIIEPLLPVSPVADVFMPPSPLLEETIKPIIINVTLKCISLAYNSLSLASVELFSAAIKSFENEKIKSSLIYVNLQNNAFSMDSPQYIEFQEMMAAKVANLK